MRILLLAPHPFYQERGTPIAVDLLLRVLSERGDTVDLLTFHEGIDRDYPGLTIHRIRPFAGLKGIKPGFSVKKLICDIYLFFRFVSLMFSNRYDVVHAVEESAFMAMLVCPFRRTRFIYDMDSSITTQLIDKFGALRPFQGILHFFESLPMRRAVAVVPMCDVLADDARQQGARQVVVLKDVSLIKPADENNKPIQIREVLKIDSLIAMYIGNLESYQGIDLLLESFVTVKASDTSIDLVIIGGSDGDIQKYKIMADSLGMSEIVHFLGQQPVDQIGQLMAQADILVSPRVHGANTPMKVYSYLHSGVAVLATDLPTHTQVMDNTISKLVDPDKASYAQGMLELAGDDALRKRLATKAHEKMEQEHSYKAFKSTLDGLYQSLDASQSNST